jgi:putative phage-type endonuclease
MTIQGNLILPAGADREVWLGTRQLGIGGSDVGKLFGYVKNCTPYKLWLIKRGELPEEEAGEAAEIGNDLEDYVAKKFAERTGHRILTSPGTLQHPEFPWMLVNVDRFVCDTPDCTYGLDCEGCAVLECKTTAGIMARKWDDEEVPEAALFQVQHALAVTGLERGYLAGLVGGFGGHRIEIVPVERDEELIEMLIKKEAEFWQRVVENDPPPVDGEASTTDVLCRRYKVTPDKIVELDDSVREIIAQREQAGAAEKAAKERKDQASNELRLLLGDAEVGTLAGKPIVSWKEQSRREHVVPASTSRVLRVKAVPQS